MRAFCSVRGWGAFGLTAVKQTQAGHRVCDRDGAAPMAPTAPTAARQNNLRAQCVRTQHRAAHEYRPEGPHCLRERRSTYRRYPKRKGFDRLRARTRHILRSQETSDYQQPRPAHEYRPHGPQAATRSPLWYLQKVPETQMFRPTPSLKSSYSNQPGNKRLSVCSSQLNTTHMSARC